MFITNHLSSRVIILGVLFLSIFTIKINPDSSHKKMWTKIADKTYLLPEDKFPEDGIRFSSLRYRYRILHNGLLSQKKPSTPDVLNEVKLGSNEDLVEGLFCFESERGLLMLVFFGDSLSGDTSIQLISEEPFSKKWQSRIPAFNIGEPLFQSKWVFISGCNFLGKINIDTGRFEWKIEGLPLGEHFNSFEKPYIRDGYVFFYEKARSGVPRYRVRVSSKTGEYTILKK